MLYRGVPLRGAAKRTREDSNDSRLLEGRAWPVLRDRDNWRRPGQTILPPVVRFDTVPGKSWSGEPSGHLVRALAADGETRYRDGYYLLSGADSLRVAWTNGFTGMTLMLRLGNVVMHGRASAWTDYQGYEQASVVLRRAACPSAK